MTSDFVTRARSLAARHLSSSPRRWAHVQGVAATAEIVAPVLHAEHSDEIVAACWLHDVGYAPDVAKTGFHPVDGATFAEGEGMPSLVVSLIAFHTGSVFEAQQRELLAELNAFAAPPRDVLDIVTYADMTTSPSGEPVSADERVAEILSRYDEDDPVFAAVSTSAPELLAAVARVDERLTVAQPR
ncbi:HD domain-containing protein [Microbacterium lacus]|uniref:HD domain-containing protein n=1 Tax=Microbacterium lacus TaxID=415217 RepID=UPI003850153C